MHYCKADQVLSCKQGYSRPDYVGKIVNKCDLLSTHQILHPVRDNTTSQILMEHYKN